MGNETILYYVFEQSITGSKRTTKTNFWRRIKPISFMVREDDLSVMTVMIPTLDKDWKREKLIKVMQESISDYQDYIRYAEVVIQPKLQQVLMQSERFNPIFWELTDMIIKDISRHRPVESLMLLLGTSFFPEEQIQRFTEMMQPYFPYVNQLIVAYEMEDDASDEVDCISNDGVNVKSEKNWNRLEAELDKCMEMLYYEYGLIGRIWNEDGYKAKPSDISNGQCQVLFLDFGYQGKLPYSMMRSGDKYIDVLSSVEKKRCINKKCSQISYLSPLKYLDTIVKSGYDKLVNQA